MLLRPLGLVWAVLILGLSPALSQKLLEPIPVDDMLRSWSFADRTPIDLSPDGRFVAYTLQTQAHLEAVTDKRYSLFNRRGVPVDGIGRTIWIVETKSGAAAQPINTSASSWGPSWSPDSSYLAFYCDKNGTAGLWIWDRRTRMVRQLSKLIARPLFGFDVPQWTPDSKKVVIKVIPRGMTIANAANLLAPPPKTENPKMGGPSVTVFPKATPIGRTTPAVTQSFVRSDSLTNRTLADLVLIDVDSGGVRTLVSRSSTNLALMSPQGTHLAYLNFKGTIPGAQGAVGDIVVVSIIEGRSKVLVANVPFVSGRELNWSPDGKKLAYITTRYPGVGPQITGDCFVVSIEGSEPRTLTTGEHPNFGANYDYSRPIWDKEGKNLWLIGAGKLWKVSVDGGPAVQVTNELPVTIREIAHHLNTGRVWSFAYRSIYVSTFNSRTNQQGFYKIDTLDGRATKLIEEDQTFGNLNTRFDISDDEKTAVFTQQDAQNYEDLWVTGAEFTSLRHLSHTNPTLDKYQMGAVQIVSWQAENGDHLKGSLLLPSGYVEGKRYPMIVEVYGGDDGSSYANLFGLGEDGVSNKQLLATRGYVVFSPDIPMGMGAPMRDVANSVLPGVQKIVEMGIADPGRVGVTGKSYGGYCTMALIVQTNIFKAAISRSGKANLITSYGTMTNDGNALSINWAEVGQGRMGGTPWQYRDRYIDNSPFFFFDRITTPVLIVAGASDTGVPAHLQDEIYVALRRLGKDVVYAKYLGGGHTETSFNYSDSVDYFNRMIDWFDKYLKATTKSEDSKQ